MNVFNPNKNNETEAKKSILYSLNTATEGASVPIHSLTSQPSASQFHATFTPESPCRNMTPKYEAEKSSPFFNSKTPLPVVSQGTESTTPISKTSIYNSTPGSVIPGQKQRYRVKMPIAGVQVEFPLEPYAVQKHMMSQVILSITKTQNCLLESPTGTGKTLALLCSSLAWQQQEIELLSILEVEAANKIIAKETTPVWKKKGNNSSQSNPLGSCGGQQTETTGSDTDEDIFHIPKRKKSNQSTEGTNDKPSELNIDKKEIKSPHKECKVQPDSSPKDKKQGDEVNHTIRAPTIFYGTRTHKQIAQVVDQLKRTSYYNKIKMTVLAARDHSCVNPMVQGKSNITELCQSLIDPVRGNGCSYYAGSTKYSNHHYLESAGVPKVFDIEDIVSVGSQRKFCPYFTLRNLVPQSDIVFCPYNYLIDPNIRESMNINVNRAIVIMDEAHNIEDTCREAASFVFKQTDLEDAIKECKENIRRSINMVEYGVIEDFFQLLYDWLGSNGQTAQYSADNEAKTPISGQQVINMFHVEEITKERFEKFKDSIDRINQNKKDNPEDNFALSGVVKQLCCNTRTVLQYLYKSENTGKYQAFFSREISTKNKTSKASWLSKHSHSEEERAWKYKLHLLCLSPAIVFSELLNARTVVLASGTLSPLDSFQSELGVKFPFIVKGRHVVPKQNLFVSTLSSGPRKVDLKGIFENVNKYEYQDELGRIILETSSRVPHGVLCFFQSYYLMEKLKDRWSATGLLEKLGELKEIFWEPRRKQEMSEVMNDFTSRIDLSRDHPGDEVGAILFGVFRGKIAEGIDFSDDNARVVIVVGIPYLNNKLMEVSLKVKFNNDNVKTTLLSGSRWYKIQAFRALNQALGRCIRHKNDWGAIILLDTRFSFKETQDNLPAWVQQQLQVYQSWDIYLNGLSSFCNRMKETNKTTTQSPAH